MFCRNAEAVHLGPKNTKVVEVLFASLGWSYFCLWLLSLKELFSNSFRKVFYLKWLKHNSTSFFLFNTLVWKVIASMPYSVPINILLMLFVNHAWRGDCICFNLGKLCSCTWCVHYADVSVQLHINILPPLKSVEMLWLVWRKLWNRLKVNTLKLFNINIFFINS